MSIKKVHIDIETYSSIDITKSGAYKYAESFDFEILMVAFAYDDQPVKMIDLAAGEKLPSDFIAAMKNPNITKCAHNAVFERICFAKFGIETNIEEWYCTAIKAAYCGLPLSLAAISKALGWEGDKGKLSSGKALIRYFCIPCKPTRVNGKRTRNFHYHDLEKWEQFKEYCIRDVEAERDIDHELQKYKITSFERAMYCLDQKINDTGILIDIELAQNANKIDDLQGEILFNEIRRITGLENPNSTAQLKAWIGNIMGEEIKSLNKKEIPLLMQKAGSVAVKKVLKLRAKSSKTSTRKYIAMQNCIGEGNRARGLFQFYGAYRTGRWAGRLIQLQNLPQNKIRELEQARAIVRNNDFEGLSLIYDDVSNILSQLIRTAFIAPKGKTFAVADFSAIEARVISWLAGEQWRLDVFNGHGKIYEASASMMFNLPFEECTKEANNGNRAKGKVAELALGYQGSVGAMKAMGGERMGLSELEMKRIVKRWRVANKAIVNLWELIQHYCFKTLKTKCEYKYRDGLLKFNYDGIYLTIQLPSGRKLFYREPIISVNKWNHPAIKYMGMNQQTKQWELIDTYGGKLTENVVQAIARDLLAESMIKLDKAGYKIVMHVHDEAACEVDLETADQDLSDMCRIMGEPIPWAKGLPLDADGYLTPFYKKD